MDYQKLLYDYFNQYKALDDDEIRLISSKFRLRKIKKHAFILRDGEIMSQYNLVAKGALRLYYLNEDFKEFSLRFAFEGQWLGDLESYVNESQSSLNIQAMENTIVFQIDRENQKRLLKEIPRLYQIFLFKYEERLLEANRRILLNISVAAEGRFDDFVANYGDYYNRIPDRHIASYIGVTPEFFSKLKNKKIKEYLEIN